MRLVPRFIIYSRIFQRSVGRRKERERIAKRHFVTVHVIAHRNGLISDKIKQYVNRIITGATTIWKTGVTGCGDSLAKAKTGVWRSQIKA